MHISKKQILKNVIAILMVASFFILAFFDGPVSYADETVPETQSSETSSETSTEATTEATTEYIPPAPAKPVVKASYIHLKGVQLKWKKVKNATKYHVYRRNKKKKYVLIATTKKLTYIDKKAKKDNYYLYKVVAAYTYNGQEICSKYSKARKVLASRINPKKKMVALTFDDGPGPYTKAIVSCLKKNKSCATFFVVGQNVGRYKSSVKAAYKAGCEIGNHSWDHAYLPSMSYDGVRSEISRTDSAVKSITGVKPKLMRSPYGALGGSVSAAGKPNILWNIDTLDWKTRNTSSTISAVMNYVHDGDIVLMHDIHLPTKNAALTIIPRLRARGYQLVTVSELAKYKGYKLKKGSSYRSLP